MLPGRLQRAAKMGYSVDLFVNSQIETEFLCPVCQDVLEDPQLVDPCEHAFCSACINMWKGQSRTCPVDRGRIAGQKKPQRLYMNLLNNLKLHCPFLCGCVVKLGDMKHHEEQCESNPENQKECEGQCGAIISQYVRKTNTHNCVLHLKKQLQETKTKLEACQLELEEYKRRNQTFQTAGTSTECGSGPVPAQKSSVAILCVRNWNIDRALRQAIEEFISEATQALSNYPEGALTLFMRGFAENIRNRVRLLYPSARPAFLNWWVTVTSRSEEAARLQIASAQEVGVRVRGRCESEISGLELEVHGKVFVRVVLKHY